MLKIKSKRRREKLFCFRPICLADAEDLSLDLNERTGVVAGWGATEVSYIDTLCGYKRGKTKPNSLSNKLKKLEGLGYRSSSVTRGTAH